MMHTPMSKERENRLESSIIKAKKYCDFCMRVKDSDNKELFMREAIEALIEISSNPAEYYVTAKTEHSTFLLGISEKEFREKSKEIIEKISGVDIKKFCENYFDFINACDSDCEEARSHLQEMYDEIVELVQHKGEEIANTIKGIKESNEKLERVLDAQTSQIKYLQTLIGRPGVP